MKKATNALIVAVLFLVSCKQNVSNDRNLPDEIQANFDNSVVFDDEVKLKVQQIEVLSNIVTIDMWLANLTAKDIWFSDDYDIEIYGLNDMNEWMPIENQSNYYLPQSGEGIYIHPYRDMFDVGMLGFSLLRDDYFNSQKLTVIVTGNIVELNKITEKKIGSFIEIFPNQ